MINSKESGWSNLGSQISDAIVTNPKTAVIIPTATAAIAPISRIAEVQGYLSIISMIIGIFVSLVLLRNHVVKGKIQKMEMEALRKKILEHDSSKEDHDNHSN